MKRGKVVLSASCAVGLALGAFLWHAQTSRAQFRQLQGQPQQGQQGQGQQQPGQGQPQQGQSQGQPQQGQTNQGGNRAGFPIRTLPSVVGGSLGNMTGQNTGFGIYGGNAFGTLTGNPFGTFGGNAFGTLTGNSFGTGLQFGGSPLGFGAPAGLQFAGFNGGLPLQQQFAGFNGGLFGGNPFGQLPGNGVFAPGANLQVNPLFGAFAGFGGLGGGVPLGVNPFGFNGFGAGVAGFGGLGGGFNPNPFGLP